MQLTVTQTLKESPEEVLAFLREAAAPVLAASAFKPGDAIAITPYPGMPAQWCLGLVGVVLMHNPDRQQVWAMARRQRWRRDDRRPARKRLRRPVALPAPPATASGGLLCLARLRTSPRAAPAFL